MYLGRLVFILSLLLISCEKEMRNSFTYIQDCKTEQCFAVIETRTGDQRYKTYTFGVTWVPCKKVKSFIKEECK